MGRGGFQASQKIQAVANAVSGGAGFQQPGGVSAYRQRIYHRVNVALTAGLQDQSVVFFNEARKQGITNMDIASSFATNQVFSATSLRTQFIYGIDRLGNRMGGTDGQFNKYVANVTATPAILTIARALEKFREMNAMATLAFQLQKDTVFEMPCLDALPWGGGQVVQAAFDNHIEVPTAAGTWKDHQTQCVNPTNGAPLTDNCWKFGPGALNIVGGQSFAFNITWPQQINWLDNATLPGPFANASAPLNIGHFITVMEGFFTQ